MRVLFAAWVTTMLLISAPTVVRAQAEGQAIADLISVERALSGMCRGWSGDDKHTDEVCSVRDKMEQALNKMGYCYGKAGQVGAEMRWHRCTQHSRR
jgi:hypothetical protein